MPEWNGVPDLDLHNALLHLGWEFHGYQPLDASARDALGPCELARYSLPLNAQTVARLQRLGLQPSDLKALPGGSMGSLAGRAIDKARHWDGQAVDFRTVRLLCAFHWWSYSGRQVIRGRDFFVFSRHVNSQFGEPATIEAIECAGIWWGLVRDLCPVLGIRIEPEQ